MDAIARHADLALVVAVIFQGILCTIPSVLFLRFSERKNPIHLSAILGMLHLIFIGGIAVAASRIDDLLWLSASILDIPSILLFHRLEHVFSMKAFFIVIGTAQYALYGLAIGLVALLIRRTGRKTAIVGGMLLLFMNAPADAAGPLTHSEIGRRAWERYLVHEDEILPGISELWAGIPLKRAFYSGCTFPDIMQDGVNDNAAEFAHWYPYQSAYLDVLSSTLPPPWDAESRQRIAFFFGMICHGAADVPWHFDEGAEKSIMTAAFDHDGAKDFMDQIGEMYCQVLYDLDRVRMPGRFYWACNDVLAAFQRAHVNVTPDEIRRGCIRQETEWNQVALLAPLAYPVFQWKWPWSRAHLEDYYYGGLEHDAALVAICLRYCYARLHGWHFYENVLVRNVLFSKEGLLAPFQDATIRIENGREMEEHGPLLYVGKSGSNESQAFVRVDVSDIAKSSVINTAELWLHIADNKSAAGEQFVTISPVGNDGFVPIPNRAGHGGWIAFDLTTLIRTSVAQPERNLGMRLKAVRDIEPVAFHSSDALKARGDGYGGTVMAYRPMLIVR